MDFKQTDSSKTTFWMTIYWYSGVKPLSNLLRCFFSFKSIWITSQQFNYLLPWSHQDGGILHKLTIHFASEYRLSWSHQDGGWRNSLCCFWILVFPFCKYLFLLYYFLNLLTSPCLRLFPTFLPFRSNYFQDIHIYLLWIFCMCTKKSPSLCNKSSSCKNDKILFIIQYTRGHWPRYQGERVYGRSLNRKGGLVGPIEMKLICFELCRTITSWT